MDAAATVLAVYALISVAVVCILLKLVAWCTNVDADMQGNLELSLLSITKQTSLPSKTYVVLLEPAAMPSTEAKQLLQRVNGDLLASVDADSPLYSFEDALRSCAMKSLASLLTGKGTQLKNSSYMLVMTGATHLEPYAIQGFTQVSL